MIAHEKNFNMMMNVVSEGKSRKKSEALGKMN
jgi:hypothetical protein